MQGPVTQACTVPNIMIHGARLILLPREITMYVLQEKTITYSLLYSYGSIDKSVLNRVNDLASNCRRPITKMSVFYNNTCHH